MSTPVVSFIISVFNGEKYLLDCIKSINDQTFGDYEVIAIDDGSSDKTVDYLSAWEKANARVSIIRRYNNGLTSALNMAIAKCKGKYLARQDADDISSSFRIEEQTAFLNKNSKTVLVGSWTVEFINEFTPTVIFKPPRNHNFISDFLERGINPLVHGSIMFRKDAFLKLPEGYRFKYCQDYDLYLRLLALGQIEIIPRILYASRRQSSRITLKTWKMRSVLRDLIMYVNGLTSRNMNDDRFHEIQKNSSSWQLMEKIILDNTQDISTSQIESQYYLSQMAEYLELNSKVNALSCSFKSIKAYPLWWKSLLSLPFCVAGLVNPSYFIKQYRKFTNNILSGYREPCFVSNIYDILDRDFNQMDNSCKG